MDKIIYLLCALTAIVCCFLLFRANRSTGHKLLFWSGMCFAGSSINNIILLLDKTLFATTADLSLLRLSSALVAVMLLLFGLIWEEP